MRQIECVGRGGRRPLGRRKKEGLLFSQRGSFLVEGAILAGKEKKKRKFFFTMKRQRVTAHEELGGVVVGS